MRIKFRKKYLLAASVMLVVLYLFWGPLFPWSPLKLGFERIESSKATLYIEDFEGGYEAAKLDEMIQEEEAFHGMKFKQKFKIFILGKKSSMKRYLPWMRGSGFSVKLGFVNVIYIGANARNSSYGVDVFLRHEISHLLIHQNVSSSEKNFEMAEQGWLTEGIATYFGGPHFYEKNSFVELWKDNGLAFDSLYEGNPLKMDINIIRLKYTYYRFFIEFLVETYGIKKLQTYLKNYTDNPRDYRAIFHKVYGKELHEILNAFNSYMNR